jgi:hypothetical protein
MYGNMFENKDLQNNLLVSKGQITAIIISITIVIDIQPTAPPFQLSHFRLGGPPPLALSLNTVFI